MNLPNILTHLLATCIVAFNLKRRMINDRPDDPTDPEPFLHLTALLVLLWTLP